MSKIPKMVFQTHLSVKVPKPMEDAIHQAASENMTTASAYIRQAIVDRLRFDGYAPESRSPMRQSAG